MFRSLINSNLLLKFHAFNLSPLYAKNSIMNASSLASGKLLLSQREGVLTIAFNNDKVRNASDPEMYDAITGQLKTATDDDSIKIVVFTGKGEYYSSGINLKCFELMISSSERRSISTKMIQSLQEFVAAFIDFPKPVIAAVNGPALGIQCTTLALKDYIVCSDTAIFQTPFSSIGVTAEGCSSVLFPKIFGFSKANSLLMFSEKLTASEALNAGFVSKVIPKQNFEKEVEDMIYGANGILNSYSYPSIMAVKALTKNDDWKRSMHTTNKAECEALLKLWSGSDFENRIRDFFAKKQQKK